MLRFTAIALGLTLRATIAPAQAKETLVRMPMPSPTLHARGTFTVAVKPLTPPPAGGLSRFSIDKQIHGDLEGTTKGEMFSGGDPRQGVAGYVAIEMFTGTLGGRHGGFALQHSGTMDNSGPKMTIIVTPGSGTGELQGIAGTFTIQIANGVHSYDFEYTVPEQ